MMSRGWVGRPAETTLTSRLCGDGSISRFMVQGRPKASAMRRRRVVVVVVTTETCHDFPSSWTEDFFVFGASQSAPNTHALSSCTESEPVVSLSATLLVLLAPAIAQLRTDGQVHLHHHHMGAPRQYQALVMRQRTLQNRSTPECTHARSLWGAALARLAFCESWSPNRRRCRHGI